MNTAKLLRIALLTYSTQPRGSVIHTLELAEALHQLGHHVCIYSLDKEGSGFDFPISCQVDLISAKPAPTDVNQLIQQRIQEFVEHFNQIDLAYDCYHAQDCLSANALALLQHQHKIPHFIRTVHHIEDYVSPYLRDCQDRSIRAASLCLCVSDRWQRALHQHYHIHAPKVINGVNTCRFSRRPNGTEVALKQRLGLNDAPIFLTVGGIEPRKNSIRLLHAFHHILQDYPTAQLVIAGGATLFDYQAYRAEFMAQVKLLGIEIGRSLILPGVLTDAELPALYRLAQTFVFPSLKEGWGLVVLEAIASGLPVITANQAPFTEFLAPHQALLVDPEDPSAIAQAMRDSLQPDYANSLQQASQDVLTPYRWDISARQHIEHYRRLCDQKSAIAPVL